MTPGDRTDGRREAAEPLTDEELAQARTYGFFKGRVGANELTYWGERFLATIDQLQADLAAARAERDQARTNAQINYEALTERVALAEAVCEAGWDYTQASYDRSESDGPWQPVYDARARHEDTLRAWRAGRTAVSGETTMLTCGKCGATVALPHTVIGVDLQPANEWEFRSDTGWTCKSCAAAAVSVEG